MMREILKRGLDRVPTFHINDIIFGVIKCNNNKCNEALNMSGHLCASFVKIRRRLMQQITSKASPA